MRFMGFFGPKAGSRAEAAAAIDVFTAPERERVEALRARQARVLPRFAAAEDATRLAEVMSFALAACVVAERFAAIAGRAAAPGWRPLTDNVPESAVVGDTPPPRPFGALLLARLAGEAGLGWLGQEPAALRALAAYFCDGPSELRAIACEAERRIGLPLDRGPPASAPDAPPAEDAPADRPTAPQPQAATTEPEPAPGRAPPPAIGGEGAGWEWINWVRAGLRDGSLAVNAPGAWLHNIEGEAYAVSAACFEAFAAGRDLAPATVRHRVVRLRRHRQRESPSGSANLFRAVLADGSRVKGMVFPRELVWDDDPPPRSNARVVVDRIRAPHRVLCKCEHLGDVPLRCLCHETTRTVVDALLRRRLALRSPDVRREPLDANRLRHRVVRIGNLLSDHRASRSIASRRSRNTPAVSLL